MLTIDQINLAFVNYPFYIGMVTMATVAPWCTKKCSKRFIQLGPCIS
jgi:hypothetical protein